VIPPWGITQNPPTCRSRQGHPAHIPIRGAVPHGCVGSTASSLCTTVAPGVAPGSSSRHRSCPTRCWNCCHSSSGRDRRRAGGAAQACGAPRLRNMHAAADSAAGSLTDWTSTATKPSAFSPYDDARDDRRVAGHHSAASPLTPSGWLRHRQTAGAGRPNTDHVPPGRGAHGSRTTSARTPPSSVSRAGDGLS
jgi:hypothetical protein